MKLKKLVALITAGALCLGMSMTAFAADDKSPDKVPSANGWANGGDLGAINTATEKEVQDIADEAMNWLEKNKPNIAANAEVIFAGDYRLYDAETGTWLEEGAKVPGGKTVFSFNVNNVKDKDGFVDGKVVYGLHKNADGTYSLVAPKTKTVARTTSPKTGE